MVATSDKIMFEPPPWPLEYIFNFKFLFGWIIGIIFFILFLGFAGYSYIDGHTNGTSILVDCVAFQYWPEKSISSSLPNQKIIECKTPKGLELILKLSNYNDFDYAAGVTHGIELCNWKMQTDYDLNRKFKPC